MVWKEERKKRHAPLLRPSWHPKLPTVALDRLRPNGGTSLGWTKEMRAVKASSSITCLVVSNHRGLGKRNSFYLHLPALHPTTFHPYSRQKRCQDRALRESLRYRVEIWVGKGVNPFECGRGCRYWVSAILSGSQSQIQMRWRKRVHKGDACTGESGRKVSDAGCGRWRWSWRKVALALRLKLTSNGDVMLRRKRK